LESDWHREAMNLLISILRQHSDSEQYWKTPPSKPLQAASH
jgi:hypothetical protein